MTIFSSITPSWFPSKSFGNKTQYEEEFVEERLSNMIKSYGKFQTQYRDFVLEDTHMAMGNWKSQLIQLDQRAVGAHTVYKDFLNKYQNKEQYPELFSQRDRNLEYFMQVMPMQAALFLLGSH